MEPVDIFAVAVDATTGAPMVVLRERTDPHRLLPIFIGGPEAASIATTVSGIDAARPLTHDLVITILDAVHAEIESAEVTELRDGAFIAQLNLRSHEGEHHLDTRPSDAIALAARAGAPVLVDKAVLDEAGTLDPTSDIDEAVEEFRSFLDDVDPSHFGETPLSEFDADEEPPTDPDGAP